MKISQVSQRGAVYTHPRPPMSHNDLTNIWRCPTKDTPHARNSSWWTHHILTVPTNFNFAINLLRCPTMINCPPNASYTMANVPDDQAATFPGCICVLPSLYLFIKCPNVELYIPTRFLQWLNRYLTTPHARNSSWWTHGILIVPTNFDFAIIYCNVHLW